MHIYVHMYMHPTVIQYQETKWAGRFRAKELCERNRASHH